MVRSPPVAMAPWLWFFASVVSPSTNTRKFSLPASGLYGPAANVRAGVTTTTSTASATTAQVAENTPNRLVGDGLRTYASRGPVGRSGPVPVPGEPGDGQQQQYPRQHTGDEVQRNHHDARRQH